MILQPAPADRIARISIRTPRAGSDSVCQNAWSVPKYFNPCSPCGERRIPRVLDQSLGEFQSMLPVRGATPVCLIEYRSQIISIHAPRAGSDARFPSAWVPCWHFNPCSPCGERQEGMVIVGHPLDISIHAPRAGSDSYGATG